MIGLITSDSEVIASISGTVASRVLTLREALKLTRAVVASAAQSAGAPPDFTASALRRLEGGREVSVDELVWLARALEVSPAELLDDELAEELGAPRREQPLVVVEPCRRCEATPSKKGVQAAVRDDISAMGDLEGVEPSLAATALRLAEAIDDAQGEDGRLLPSLAKELRATLKELSDGRRGDGDGDELDDLASA